MGMWGNQRGDTLIEVVIATVIIASVLFSAYALSSKAFQIGQSAKERTQAAELIQQQAEALTAMRDNAPSWSAFYNEINSIDRSAFHVAVVSGQWDPQSNLAAPETSEGYWKPGCAGASCGLGQDPNVADYYELKVSAVYETNPSNPPAVDKIIFTIDVKWPRLGGGQEETSQLVLKLTDKRVPTVSYAPPKDLAWL